MAHYLGLDSSTQSLSALVIDAEAGRVVLDESLSFGTDLPEYGSPNGFLENPDPTVRHSNPLLWVAALDTLLSRIKAKGYGFASVVGISGAGQQHGSVYLKTPIAKASPWSAERPLVEQVAPLLSRATSPIWMDSSTSAECSDIARALGGDAQVVKITGSRAIERFTGPQIRKFSKTDPDAYAATAEIQLVSSFMASVLAGTSVPIDLGDGAGMNLLDLAQGAWSEALLDATAPDLKKKLLSPVPSTKIVGSVAPYFVEKYGFSPDTPIVAFTGDNPSSLIGMGASAPGSAIISLGTSDTVFAAMREPHTDPRGFGHVFGNPAGGFMCLICFSNGSLAREKVREKVALDWPGFERAILKETEPGNAGALMLPYFSPETTPKLLEPKPKLFGDANFTAWRDAAQAARAVVEAQALSMQHYSDWIGETPKTILATGGASRNAGILQIIADVFQAEVRTLEVRNSSALGGALRAAQAIGELPWEGLFEKFAAPDARIHIQPNADAAAVYGGLRERFAAEVGKLLS